MQQARDATSGVVVVNHLRCADTHWSRLFGLLGTKELPSGEGLWLKRSRQVHMIGMRYPIDVAFLDDELQILRTISALRPGKVSPRVAGATSVLELPAGTLAETGLKEGARMEIDGELERSGGHAGTLATAISNLALACLYVFFASAHFTFARRTGQWRTAMPIVALEAVLVCLALTRRRSVGTSSRPADWTIGVLGAFLPLLLRPDEGSGPLARLAEPLQAVGLLITLAGVVSLGRSFGLIAADRGIKTSGAYRVVRHPLYAGYLLGYLGYLGVYPSLWNCAITVGTAVALNWRAHVEERFLARDRAYRAYLRRVRWRFLPSLY